MEVRSFPDAAACYDTVSPLLLQREAEYGLMIGVLLQLREAEGAGASSEPALLRVVSGGGQVLAAAVRTPPGYLMITRASETAVLALVEHLWADGIALPGVSGPCDSASTFARAWSERTGRDSALKATERIYCIREVIAPDVSGHAEVARGADHDLLLAWWLAASGDDNAAYVQRRIDERSALLWKDPAPVSMASVTRPTPHGIGIGGVYTPPESRRRGYASAVVAALSQRQLDAGRRF